MSIITFYEQLLTSGDVVIPDSRAVTESELRQVTQFLSKFEQDEYRAYLPAGIPKLELAPLQWAAGVFFRAAQFLVFRELGPELLTQDLSVPAPAVTSPVTAYSVDLVWRFLPDLYRIARTAAADDPLVDIINSWAKAWPLSAVGLPIDITPGEQEPPQRWLFLENRGLRRLYLDQILEQKDSAPLRQHPELLEAVLLEPATEWARPLKAPAVNSLTPETTISNAPH